MGKHRNIIPQHHIFKIDHIMILNEIGVIYNWLSIKFLSKDEITLIVQFGDTVH